MTDEKTGKLIEGTSVRYLMAENLTHKEDTQRSVKGYVPAKCTVPYAEYENFKVVPGLYSAEMTYSVDSKGKAAITPIKFTFLNPLNLANGLGFGAAKAPAAAKEAK